MASLLCLGHILQQTKEVINDSGHFIFQYGNYGSCLDTEGFSYNLVELGIGQANTGMYLGLCLPTQCTSPIIKQSLGLVLKQLQLPFNIYAVESNIPNYQFPYTPLFYLTVIAIMILIVCVILGTISHKSRSGVFRSFALQKSTEILISQKESQLNIFNGIRALSMMWVILGHTYLNSLTGSMNVLQVDNIFASPFILLISGGLLSVDIFFFLGGFFFAFVFMRQKTRSILKYPFAIIQRALRIWPAYFMTIIFYYSVFMHLGSGPRWPANEPIVNMCHKFWRSLLFIENIADDGTQSCLVWGWYLQVDFQMFLVCLLLLGVYSYRKQVSIILGALLIGGSWTYNIIYTEVHQQKIFIDVKSLMAFLDYFQQIYIKPWARWSPYILGMFLGVLYVQYTSSIKDQSKRKGIVKKCHQIKDFLMRKRVVRIVIEWIGVGLMAFVVFVTRPLQTGSQWPQVWHTLYFCYSRIIFILGLIMVISSTLLGIKTSFFKTILDTSLFSFVAKISFCVYLVHYIVLSQVISYVKGDIYYFIPDRFMIHIAICVLSCFFGTLLTVFVELPFSFLQKEFMSRLKKIASKPKIKQAQEQQNMEKQALNDVINASEISPLPERSSIQAEE